MKNNTDINTDNLQLDFFEAEEGGILLEAFIIDDGRHAIVKEVLPEGMAYTFFDLASQSLVERADRYAKEHGQLSIEKIDDTYKSISEVTVDTNTGFEKVDEKILKGDETVYHNVRERYPSSHIEPAFTRYLAYQQQKSDKEIQTSDLVEKYFGSDFPGKVDILRGMFRNEWRSRCELGFDHPEFFLTKNIYAKLSKDSHFEDALMSMLKLEEEIVDIAAVDLYNNIQEEYRS